MSREYSPYLHMHELQPPPPPHYSYPLQHQQALSNSSATPRPAYEMTASSAADGACAGGTLPSSPSLHPLDPRKRKSSHFDGGGEYEVGDVPCAGAGCERAEAAVGGATRKRNSSSFGTASAYDDDGGDDSRSSRANSCATMPDKKQNHSEIEKRRRDKMNTYITELSSMIPMCGAIARKLDKLTVLRMAVQHLRTVRGSLSACPLAARPRPAFVSERELNGLLLEAASDTFLLVVGCDRGRLLYVSHSVTNMLHYEQCELLGQSMFDILHPKDVAKVKEQLSSSDLGPRARLIDAKTMLPVKAGVAPGAQRLCPGARRSFFCRIKCKQEPAPVKEEAEPDTKHRKKKYCVVQCTGYLKSWAAADVESGGGPEGDDEQCTMSCLVAIGRALPDLTPPAAPAPHTRPLQYVSRHAIDGKFLFVDQRVTLALGFLPQELLGTSLYEYVSAPALGAVARAHKHALVAPGAHSTPPYRFRRKDGATATIQTHFKPFRNPWTKDVECLVASNSVVSEARDGDERARLHHEACKQSGDTEMQRLIDSQVESHKIGAAIAEEASRRAPPPVPAPAPPPPPPAALSPLPAHLLQDPAFNTSLMDNILGVDLNAFTARNAVPPPAPASPPLAPLGIDGNGEAAMAVIMSLLEADAGLGGPVNFSGLPWPLP